MRERACIQYNVEIAIHIEKRRVRYHLPIILPQDTLLDLQREARNGGVPMEVLILEMIEDYLEDRKKAERSATSTTRRPTSALRLKRK